MVRRAGVVAGVALAALFALAGLPARADAPSPTVTVTPPSSAVGQSVAVKGSGWDAAAGGSATVVLCGNAGLDGAADCLLTNTAIGAVAPDGSFYTSITLRVPPSPCPCVLRVDGQGVGHDVDVPIVIAGVRLAPPSATVHSTRGVRVDGVRLSGWGPWTAWLWGGPRRTLTYRVTNTGDVVLHSPNVTLAWGTGAQPSGYAAPPDIGDLQPGQSKTFHVSVASSALSVGSFHAIVRVDPLGTVGTGSAGTLVLPWGTIVLVVLFVAWRVGQRRRGRRSAAVTVEARSTPAAARVVEAPPAAEEPPLGLAGWYPDPLATRDDARSLRLWDGAGWTERVRPLDDHDEVAASSPGWYPDPLALADLRLWEGSGWTEHTSRLDDHVVVLHDLTGEAMPEYVQSGPEGGEDDDRVGVGRLR